MTSYRQRLRAALDDIEDPCPFCDDSVAYVAWNADTGHERVKTVHPTKNCPATTPGVFQDRATSFLVTLLRNRGIPVAEYLEDDLVGWHAIS